MTYGYFDLNESKVKIQVLSQANHIQVFNQHMWLEATALDSTDRQYFCHCRKFYQTVLLKTNI